MNELLLLSICVVAAIYDVRTRRIPNELTLSCAIAGLVTHAASLTTAGIYLVWLCGAVAAGFALYRLGGIGAGDVKLLAAGTALLGWPLGLTFLLYSALCGGLQALAALLARRNGYQTLFCLLATPGALRAGASGVKVPYALAIAGGALCTALSVSLVPALRTF